MRRETYFKVGGTLRRNSPCYVVRDADRQLFAELMAGEFCYVLAPRSTGKSSLRVRVMDQLLEKGVRCAVADMHNIGSDSDSTESWYYSFLYMLARSLNLGNAFIDWWKQMPNFTPVSKLSIFFESFLPDNIEQSLVIFLDEIDALLKIKGGQFSIDDFFACIRACHNNRPDEQKLSRITFAILGVAAPGDLIEDPQKTPFNIGIPIELKSFTFRDCTQFMDGFSHLDMNQEELLKGVLSWTDGHPYFTQQVCKEIARSEHKLTHARSVVDAVINRLYFTSDILNSHILISRIHERIIQNHAYSYSMLDMYKRILEDESIQFNSSDLTQTYLRLTGLVKVSKGYLLSSNRIFSRVFDENWIHRTYGEIDRPFLVALQRWLDSDESPDYVLKGQSLQEYNVWISKQQNPTRKEVSFLYAGQREAIHQQHISRQKELFRRGILAMIPVALSLPFLLFFFANIKKENGELNQQLSQLSQSLRQLVNDTSTLKYQNDSLKDLVYTFSHFARDSVNGKQQNQLPTSATVQATDPTINSQSQQLTGDLDRRFSYLTPTSDSSLLQILTDSAGVVSSYVIPYIRFRENQIAKAVEEEAYQIPSFSTFLVNDIASEFIRLEKNLIYPGTIQAQNIFFPTDLAGSIITGEDGHLIYWEYPANLHTLKLSKNPYDFSTATISRDKSYILAGTIHGDLCLIKLKSHDVLWQKEGHHGHVQTARFSPDNKLLISGGSDLRAIIRDVATGQQLQILQGHEGWVRAVGFIPQNSAEKIAFTAAFQHIRLWNAHTGELIHTFQTGNGAILTAIPSPDGKHLLTGGSDRQLSLFNLSGEKVMQYSGHTSSVLALDFSPDGNYIASGASDEDPAIILWERYSSRPLGKFPISGHDNILAVAFSEDGKHLMIACQNGLIQKWDISRLLAIRP